MLNVTDIALNRLVPSLRNVRRTGSGLRIEELAASIEAHGLLQNLTVIETVAKGKKAYEVIAGGRRLAACKLLAKRKAMAANAPIPCHVITDENATELSLAENALQERMHPSDEYESYKCLHEDYGMGIEDIAARFGVSPTVVRQRLKLAKVSPKLIEAYRQDAMNLDQLTAFTICDDHARQEQVWAEYGPDASREELRLALMTDEIHASDPLARLVGREPYEAAGGIIVRDLFDEAADGGYFADTDLLIAMADAILAAETAKVEAEGWKWVETMRRFDFAFTAELRRLYPKPVPLSEADQIRFDELQAEYERHLNEPEGEARDAELERLEAALDELRTEDVFAPEDIARAGAIVSVRPDGTLRIERGYLRPEDGPGQPRAAREKQEGPKPLSAALVGALTAQQTLCLRDALGGNGEAALIAVTHALAAPLFYLCGRVSCLELRTGSRFLDTLSPGITESPAGRRIAARHEAWGQRLPDEAEGLWSVIAALDPADRLALLAHCVGLSVDAVLDREDGTRRGFVELAEQVGLDMRPDWQPTAENYFGRVSRERILDAVREGASPGAADNLAKLNKAALAAEAERRLKDKGWLPPLLRLAA